MRLLLAALVLLAAPALAQQDAMIHVAGNRYLPAATEMEGGEVIVMNFDPEEHTVTADDGTFHVRLLAAPPSNFTEERFAAPPPGEHAFGCLIHPSMRGILTVHGAPEGTTTTPAPTGEARETPAGALVAALAVLGAAALARAGRRRR